MSKWINISCFIIMVSGCAKGNEQVSAVHKVHATTYYIDADAGNDNNKGTAANVPFKSLSALQDIKLHPGDSVKFKRGSSFTGPLFIKDSGSANHYIVLTDYGSPRDSAPTFTNPVFEQGNFGNCIRIEGGYVLVENLYFFGTAAYRSGTYNTDGWAVWQMGAIYIDKGAAHCVIRNNEIEDCVAGIRSYGEHARIEHNYIHDCNRVLAEWNWGPIGIWLGGDYQEVKYNKIINYRAEDPRISWANGGGGADGGAFEIDDARYDKSHITIAYNITQNCQGFLEVTYNDVVAGPTYTGFRIHHNISDDYQQFIALWAGAGCHIENNTIIRRKKNANDWGVFNITENKSYNMIINNTIVTEKDIPVFNVGLDSDHNPQTIIRNNLYYAASGNLVIGKEGPGDNPVYGDPLLEDYDNSNHAGDYSIKKGSPAIDAGLDLGYQYDFMGTAIADGDAPDIGAFEFVH